MASAAIAWTPITEHFGAEIDIDLNGDLQTSVTEELRRLFDERHLLLFRDQAFDYEAQRKIASIFGNVLPFKGDAKYVSTIHNFHGDPVKEPRDPDFLGMTRMFHSDMMFLKEHPVQGICLFAEEIAGNNPGTRFISTRNPLSKSARAELEGRTAIHFHGLQLPAEDHLRLREIPFDEVKDKIDFWAEHPLCFPNPRTGQPTLLYAPVHTHSIVGMSQEECRSWFDQFDALLYDASKMYTHHWQTNDFMIWDNFAVQHSKETVVHAGLPPIRVLRRATLGPTPNTVYGADPYRGSSRKKRHTAAA